MLAELPQIEKSRLMACGSSASEKKNVLAFAEVPQAKKNVLAFAEVPQIEKRAFWHLRKFRKRKKNVSAFAELPQAFPKTVLPADLFRGKHKKEMYMRRFRIAASLPVGEESSQLPAQSWGVHPSPSFMLSSSSIRSEVLLKGGTLCWPPSLPWLRSQSKKRPGRAGMISGGAREISL